jgi:serine/threonine protein kinase
VIHSRPVAESQAPVAFGRYRVQQKLGAGGMGAVYLARDESLGRDVAVKVLRPLIAVGDPPAELVERFRREARAIALLSHANVVRVYDQGVEGGLPYLVMELVAGPTLADRLNEGGPLELREVRTLGIQLASALDAAHAAGIVHRDVKPSNVIQAGTGGWKLADFGIAHTDDSSLTITGQFLGTPAFAAPEALDGRSVAAPADVYSLAATLYAALTGEAPYGDANLAQLILAITRGQRPAPVADRRADVPPGISAALQRAMSIDPEARPSAAELAHELAVHERIATPVPGTLSAPPPRPSSPRRLKPILIVGGLMLGALVLGLALGGGDGHKSPLPRAAPVETPTAAVVAPESAALGPPPWQTEMPPELRGRGKPSDQSKRWRKAHEKLNKGEWDKGAEELFKILEDDPENETARRWLAWMDRAARDPAAAPIEVWHHDSDHSVDER